MKGILPDVQSMLVWALNKVKRSQYCNTQCLQFYLVTISGKAVKLLVQARALHLVVNKHLSSGAAHKQLVAIDDAIAAARVASEARGVPRERTRVMHVAGFRQHRDINVSSGRPRAKLKDTALAIFGQL